MERAEAKAALEKQISEETAARKKENEAIGKKRSEKLAKEKAEEDAKESKKILKREKDLKAEQKQWEEEK